MGEREQWSCDDRCRGLAIVSAGRLVLGGNKRVAVGRLEKVKAWGVSMGVGSTALVWAVDGLGSNLGGRATHMV